MTRAALLVAALLLVACGGARQPAPAGDEVLAGLAAAARGALDNDEPTSAAGLYARALARAHERDEAPLIDDMAFGQAVALLASGDPASARRVAGEEGEALARRGRTPSPRLLLAEATALHRLGHAAEARDRAAEVARRGAEDAEAALRAQFLLGLLAATRGDAAALEVHRATLTGARQPAFRADAAELDAHLALLRAEPALAAARAGEAADLRRQAIDYRGLSRALALEGTARARVGEAARAADLLFRAGQGAVARGEAQDARAWLAEAARLAQAAGRPALLAEVRAALARLDRR